MRIKVLSWNIWVDCHFDDFKTFITDADADIVCLQEVRENDPEGNIVKFMTSLGYTSALGLKQYWETQDFYFGPATFAKNKIVSSEIFELSQKHTRFAVRADIQFDSGLLHVFNAHLRHEHQKPSEVQMKQAQTLLGLMPETRAIAAGDFNATPDSAVIQRVSSILNNTDPSNTPTWSMYPEGCPECNPQAVDTRLDYIFCTKDLQTSDPKVETSAASDHLPISVTVEI